ncbi:polyprenyl synthetase family protein, partial [bacterium]|nr:polyprenyl synthetase family protein [bacterium]
GGKRVRPLLTCLLAEACGSAATHPAVLLCASAVELIHTYSLVHDDLPCMDNDDLRRGKPTVHKVFGEANALLVGDALLTHAFFLIHLACSKGLPAHAGLRCVEILSRCAGAYGMIGGQWKDLANTNNSSSTQDWQTLCGIHNLKTGVLLGAACALGVVAGTALRSEQLTSHSADASKSIVQIAEKLGLQIGLTFQIVDDILDATQSSSQLGKTAGKDLAQQKLTAISLLGIEGARKEAHKLTQMAFATIDDLGKQLDEFQKKILPETNHGSPANTQNLWQFIHQLLLRTS